MSMIKYILSRLGLFSMVTLTIGLSGAVAQGASGPVALELWGMTYAGGQNSVGAIFKTASDGTNYSAQFYFSTADGSHPMGSLVQAANGKLYGMTNEGGANSYGVLFEFDPVSGTYAKKVEFNGSGNGSYPDGDLIEAGNGKFYGLTYLGGQFNNGVLFEYDALTSTYTKKIDLNASVTGGQPMGSLLKAANGKLYGLTVYGGANNNGVLFEFDPTTGALTVKFDFDGSSNGSLPRGSLMQASNGYLYGMTYAGGANDQGVIFKYDLDAGVLTKTFDFDQTAGGAHSPQGALTEAPNGKLYGLTEQGGSGNTGLLFTFDVSTNLIAPIFSFTQPYGTGPQGTLTLTSDGKLYGMTNAGGVNSAGTVFEVDPSANTYTKKSDLIDATGEFPIYGKLMVFRNSQQIKFDTVAAKTVGDGPFTISATASSGLPVTYSVNSSKTTIAGDVITIVSAGRDTVTATQSGNYTFLEASAILSFCINPVKPVVTITHDRGMVVLNSSAATGNQWYVDGAVIANATTNTFTPTRSGTYKVQASADDCVSAFSDDNIEVVTGDLKFGPGLLSIYPNPTNDFMVLSGIEGGVSDIAVIDVLGRSISIKLERFENLATADVRALSPGLYVIRIEAQNNIQQLKFIKQ
jgi:uncharacterized repeat protein (TIGR03803 family)